MSYAPNTFNVGEALTFSVNVTGGVPPYSVSWDFGDGTSAAGMSVTKTYLRAGVFHVVVTASDSAGSSVSGYVDLTIVQVGVQAPVTYVVPGTPGTYNPPANVGTLQLPWGANVDVTARGGIANIDVSGNPNYSGGGTIPPLTVTVNYLNGSVQKFMMPLPPPPPVPLANPTPNVQPVTGFYLWVGTTADGPATGGPFTTSLDALNWASPNLVPGTTFVLQFWVNGQPAVPVTSPFQA